MLYMKGRRILYRLVLLMPIVIAREGYQAGQAVTVIFKP